MSAPPLDLVAGHRALRGAGAAVRLERDTLVVSGPEATSFLQGQLSQDVAGLAVRSSAWSLLLQPSGKVDAWLRVSRLADDRFLLDVDSGWGEAVVARLERFKLRTKASVEVAPDWHVVAVRAAEGTDVEALAAGVVTAMAPGDPADEVVVASAACPGLAGVDVLAPLPFAVELGLPEAGTDAYEVARIECGVPSMGAELTDATIPAEAGAWLVSTSVSFTKGCYTGQELVARIDSRRAQVPRPLRGVVVDEPVDLPPVGAELQVDEVVVGRLTSVCQPPDRAGPVGLAPVARSVEASTPCRLVWSGGNVAASVTTVPLPAPA